MSLLASAPGKVMIVGEYSVLAGHPALVMAADRRVRVRLGAAPQWRLVADGGPAEVVDDAFMQAADPPTTPVALALWSAARALAVDSGPLAVTVDSTALQQDGRKLGLGSSAAVAVALTAALAQHSALEAVSLETYFRAHDQLQGTAGSGFDVAAAVQGGWLEFRREDHAAWMEPVARPPVPLRFIWTGTIARTTGFVSRFRDWQARAAESAELLGRLGSAADAATAAARGAQPAAFVAALEAGIGALTELATAADLPIFAGGHAELVQLGRTMGVTYKPCGAGGGDIGVAVAEDETRLAAFMQALRGTGHEPLELECDPHGVRVERQATGIENP